MDKHVDHRLVGTCTGEELVGFAAKRATLAICWLSFLVVVLLSLTIPQFDQVLGSIPTVGSFRHFIVSEHGSNSDFCFGSTAYSRWQLTNYNIFLQLSFYH